MKISLGCSIALLASEVVSSYVPLGSRDSGRPSLQYTPNYFDQRLDHFPGDGNSAQHTNATFKQRYYVDSSYYKSGKLLPRDATLHTVSGAYYAYSIQADLFSCTLAGKQAGQVGFPT